MRNLPFSSELKSPFDAPNGARVACPPAADSTDIFCFKDQTSALIYTVLILWKSRAVANRDSPNSRGLWREYISVALLG